MGCNVGKWTDKSKDNLLRQSLLLFGLDLRVSFT